MDSCYYHGNAYILAFQKQDGEESTGLSYKAADIILTVCDKAGLVDYNDNNRDSMIESVQFPIRKAAHMTEYAVLSVLIMLALIVDGLKGTRLPVISAIIATVFAATDEFHQRFVPGRYGCLRDVLIDAAGSIIGLMIAYVIYKNMCKHKETNICNQRKLNVAENM